MRIAEEVLWFRNFRLILVEFGGLCSPADLAAELVNATFSSTSVAPSQSAPHLKISSYSERSFSMPDFSYDDRSVANVMQRAQGNTW